LGANAFFASYPVAITPAATAFIVSFGPTPFYAALLLALARYDGMISRGLSYPAIVYGGEISYSIYLFHQIVIRWHSENLQVFSAIPIWCQYAGLLAATLMTAAAVHHAVERPARRWIRAAWKLLTSKMATAA
jgi:peptidoglycan/LPS O-acetylase OafA/YrhL